jgi:hypothetical protein
MSKDGLIHGLNHQKLLRIQCFSAHKKLTLAEASVVGWCPEGRKKENEEEKERMSSCEPKRQ